MLTDVYSEGITKRIFSFDKIGCITDPTGKQMFFIKSSKENYLMTPNCGKAMYTVLVAGLAEGKYLPPQFLLRKTFV